MIISIKKMWKFFAGEISWEGDSNKILKVASKELKTFHTHIENVNFTVSYQFFSVRSFLRWCQQCLMKWRHNFNNFCEKKLWKQLITCLKGLQQVEDCKKRKLGDLRTHNFFNVSIFDHVSTSWTRWGHATPGSREKIYYLLILNRFQRKP